MKKKNKIFIISASDRYNFGDLLFNYIVDFFLSDFCKKKYEITFTSLYGNDLQSVHGHKTIGLKKALKSINNGDIVIFAGGGVLGHKYTPMFEQIYNNRFLTLFKKIIGTNNYEKLIRKFIFRIDDYYPYTKSSQEFNCKVKIIYNSVGGGALKNVSLKELENINNILKESAFISVRDEDIKNSLAEINVELAPDSAVLLSELFTKDFLYNKSSKSIRSLIDKRYVLLHFNKGIANKYYNEVSKLIRWISDVIACDVVLLPVNFINNSDIEGQKLFKDINSCLIINDEIKLFEICALIAHAQLLIGSSLHTNIIACSYGVPHLGITKSVRKVNNFFSTWYPEKSIFNSYEIGTLNKIIPKAIVNKKEILAISNKLRKLAKINFDKINSIIINNNEH